MANTPSTESGCDAYGMWDSLDACTKRGAFIQSVPAHDGDFFPESPLDHVEELRKAVPSGLSPDYAFWPVRVDVDVIQACTDNCGFCYSRKYASDAMYNGARIARQDFERLTAILASGGTRTVRFTGGGEPLLHPDIQELLAIPHTHGLRSCLITNGVLLDSTVSSLCVSCLDHVRISLNAVTEETRSALHRCAIPGWSLPRVFEQLREMARMRGGKSGGARTPLIWTTFLLLPENVHEIRQAAVMARECGADSISFRPIYHKLASPFTPAAKRIMEEQLHLARQLHHPPSFSVFTPKRDVESVWHLLPASHFQTCFSSRLRTVVEASNAGLLVKLCGLHRGPGGRLLGILNDVSAFPHLWRSSHVRKQLRECPQTCTNCIDLSMNVTLNQVWAILGRYPDAVFRKAVKGSSVSS